MFDVSVQVVQDSDDIIQPQSQFPEEKVVSAVSKVCTTHLCGLTAAVFSPLKHVSDHFPLRCK